MTRTGLDEGLGHLDDLLHHGLACEDDEQLPLELGHAGAAAAARLHAREELEVDQEGDVKQREVLQKTDAES